jgi:hypothetical protein
VAAGAVILGAIGKLGLRPRALAGAVLALTAAGCGGMNSANTYAALTPERARVQAVTYLHRADPQTSLMIVAGSGASQTFEPSSGRSVWRIDFAASHGSGSGYSGCSVYVRKGVSHFSGKCTGWRN